MDLFIHKGIRFRNHGFLDVKSYIKPTETYQYLSRDSCHPASVFSSLITGEATRHCRNNNTLTEYESVMDNFSLKLQARGYSETEIEASRDKVNHDNRQAHLTKPDKHISTDEGNTDIDPLEPSNNRQLVYVTTYDPKWTGFKQVLLKHWHLIEENAHLKTLFPNKPLVAYKRASNIGDLITSTKLHNGQTPDEDTPHSTNL